MFAITLVAALAAIPQQTNAPTEFGIQFGPGAVGPASEVVTGEFNDTSLLDLAALRGETVTVAFDPGLGEAYASLPGSYTGLASSLMAGSECMVTSGGDGLQRHIWHTSTSSFQAEDILDPGQGLPWSLLWVDALMLRSGELGGGSGADLVGVTRNRTEVIVAYWNGQAMEATQRIANLPRVIEDVCLADGDGDGVSEIWVATSDEIRVYQPGGSLLAVLPSGGEQIALQPIASLSGIGQDVAHIAQHVPGRQMLTVFDGDSRTAMQRLRLHSLGPIAARSALYNDDDWSDLVLTCSLDDRVVVLLGGASRFSLGTSSVVHPIHGQIAVPDPIPSAVFDLDHDGDRDIGLLYGNEGTLYLDRSLEIDGSTLSPKILSTSAATSHIWFDAAPDPPFRFDSTSIRIDVGAEAMASMPAEATHIEVLLWITRRGPNGTFITDAVPVDQVAIPVDSTDSRMTYVEPGGLEHVFFERELTYFAGANEAQDLHFVTVRFVRLDGAGVVAESWPHRTLYFGLLTNTFGLEQHDLMPFTTPGLAVLSFDPWGNIQPSGGTEVGGGGATGCIPNYPPGTPPNTPPPPTVL